MTFTNKVAVLPSKIHGKGLKALYRINTLEKIQEITGEAISQSKANKKINDGTGFYLFQGKRGKIIDGSLGDSIGKYTNHSCNPNAIIKPSKTEDGVFEIFATKFIEELDEVTVDFGIDGIGENWPEIKCNCGSDNCRGVVNYYGHTETHNSIERSRNGFVSTLMIEKGEKLVSLFGRKVTKREIGDIINKQKSYGSFIGFSFRGSYYNANYKTNKGISIKTTTDWKESNCELKQFGKEFWITANTEIKRKEELVLFINDKILGAAL